MPCATVEQRVQASEIETGSVMLFFLLLPAFIAVLALCRSEAASDASLASFVSAAALPTASSIPLRVGSRLIRSVSLPAADVLRPRRHIDSFERPGELQDGRDDGPGCNRDGAPLR
jgi:hypothetical protein